MEENSLYYSSVGNFPGLSPIKESQSPCGKYFKERDEFLLERNFKRWNPKTY
jgi:hypothetical protein